MRQLHKLLIIWTSIGTDVLCVHTSFYFDLCHFSYILCVQGEKKRRVENPASSRMRGRLMPMTAFCKTPLSLLSQQHRIGADVPGEDLLLKMHMLHAMVTAPQEACAAPPQQTHPTGGLQHFQLETCSRVTCSPLGVLTGTQPRRGAYRQPRPPRRNGPLQWWALVLVWYEDTHVCLKGKWTWISLENTNMQSVGAETAAQQIRV